MISALKPFQAQPAAADVPEFMALLFMHGTIQDEWRSLYLVGIWMNRTNQ
jgi:hypothetical protein